MNQRLYITLAYSMNVAAQAFGYVNLLKARTGRLQTALVLIGVTAIPIFADGVLLREHIWAWTTVIPTIFVLVTVLFKDKFVRKLSVFCLMCLTELCADLMLWPVAMAVSGSGTFMELQNYVFSPASFLLRVCYALLLLVLITILILLLQRHKDHTVDRRQPMLMLFISIQALAQVVLLAIALVRTGATLESADVFTLWVLNGCSLCTLGALLAVAMREDRHAAQLERAMVRSRLEQEYVQNEPAYMEEAGRIRTEVMAQLDSLWAQLADEDSAAEASAPAALRPLHADSPAVNALLEYKTSQAKQQHIHFDCRGRLDVPVLSEFAMCTIVGNLLDNALSSVSPADPWVTLACVSRGGNCSLICRNSMQLPEQKRSRPPAEPHGLGLSIIRSTTLEAGGRMYVQSAGGIFSVILSFPQSRENDSSV